MLGLLLFRETNSGDYIPPVEGERFSDNVGATMNFPMPQMVCIKVINKGAGQAQWFQEGPDFCFQATLPINVGTKWFRNAKVLSQDEHVDLQGLEKQCVVSAGVSQELPY